jgi:O-antigen/teichoic acid export membrane protein
LRLPVLYQQVLRLLLLNLISKPLWVIVENTVQDRLGQSSYGLYAAMWAWAMVLFPAADLGLNQYAIQLLANPDKGLHTAQDSAQPVNPLPAREQALAWLRQLLQWKAILAIIYMVLLLLVGWIMGYGNDTIEVLILCAVIHLLLGLLQLGRSTLQAFQNFRWDSWLSVADKALLMLLLGALYLQWNSLDVHTYLWLMLLATAATTVVCWAVIVRKIGWPTHGWLQLPEIQLLRHSWPFAWMMVLFTVNEHFNKIMIKAYLGDYANGLYAASFRWFSAFSMYLWTILPYFYAKFAIQAHEPIAQQQRLFNLAQVLVGWPMLVVSLALWWYGDLLFALLPSSTVSDLVEMKAVLQVLAIALLINGTFNVYSTYLTATGHTNWVNYWLMASIVMVVAMMSMALSKMGIVLVAWSLVVSFTLLAIGYLIGFRLLSPLMIPLQLLGALFLCLCSGVVCYFLLESVLLWPPLAVIVVATGVMGAVAWLAGLHRVYR